LLIEKKAVQKMIEWPLVDEDISKAKTLPGFMYGDTEVYAQSLAKVFAPSWQLVPAQYQIQQEDSGVSPFVLLPGSLAEHLLLVKDRAGQLRCLSNVCTHRGMLLIDKAGPATALRCGYHGRSFDLEGKMTGMPEFEQAKNFPTSDDNLTAAKMATWGRLSFVQLEPGHSFDEVLQPVIEAMSWLPLSDFEFDESRSRVYDVQASWALYCENFLEGFHIPFVHPELNRHLAWQNYEVHLQRYSSLQVGVGSPGDPVFELPPGHPDQGKNIAAYYWFVFPNLMLNFYPWGMSVNIVEPTGPRSCRVRFQSHVWRPDLCGKGAGGPLDEVEREDEAVVEAVQKGVVSRLYHRGRYSPTQEQGTHHLHRLWLEQLQARPSD
jgi:choline monooxygenase